MTDAFDRFDSAGDAFDRFDSTGDAFDRFDSAGDAFNRFEVNAPTPTLDTIQEINTPKTSTGIPSLFDPIEEIASMPTVRDVPHLGPDWLGGMDSNTKTMLAAKMRRQANTNQTGDVSLYPNPSKRANYDKRRSGTPEERKQWQAEQQREDDAITLRSAFRDPLAPSISWVDPMTGQVGMGAFDEMTGMRLTKNEVTVRRGQALKDQRNIDKENDKRAGTMWEKMEKRNSKMRMAGEIQQKWNEELDTWSKHEKDMLVKGVTMPSLLDPTGIAHVATWFADRLGADTLSSEEIGHVRDWARTQEIEGSDWYNALIENTEEFEKAQMTLMVAFTPSLAAGLARTPALMSRAIKTRSALKAVKMGEYTKKVGKAARFLKSEAAFPKRLTLKSDPLKGVRGTETKLAEIAKGDAPALKFGEPAQVVSQSTTDIRLFAPTQPGHTNLYIDTPDGIGIQNKYYIKNLEAYNDILWNEAAGPTPDPDVFGRAWYWLSRMGSDLMGMPAVNKVKGTASGRLFEIGLNEAGARSAEIQGLFSEPLLAAIKGMSREERKWLTAIDDNGFTNLRLMQEYNKPASSPGIQAYHNVWKDMMRLTGQEAERIGVPREITPNGEVALFQRSVNERLPRALNRNARVAIQNGSGPLYEGIQEAIVRFNPEDFTLEQASLFLKELRDPGAVKNVGTLENVRQIKHLPDHVYVRGAWRAIQETDPFKLFDKSVREMGSRMYLIEQFGAEADVTAHALARQSLVKGAVEKYDPSINFSEDLISALAKTHGEEGGNPGDFADILRLYTGQKKDTGYLDPLNPLAKIAKGGSALAGGAQTSLSSAVNLPQPFASAYRLGAGNVLKGMKKAYFNRKATISDHAGIGSYTRSMNEKIVLNQKRASSQKPLSKSLLRTSREAPVAPGSPGHALPVGTVTDLVEQLARVDPENVGKVGADFMGRATGLKWISENNNIAVTEAGISKIKSWRLHGMTKGEMAAAKSAWRMTPEEIDLAMEGFVSIQTERKVLGNIVRKTQFITEFPWQKGQLIESNPFLSAIVSYNQYMYGTARNIVDFTREVIPKIITGNKAKTASLRMAQRFEAGGQIVAFTASMVSAGTVGLMIRRAFKGRNLVEEDESAIEIALKGLFEVGILGPVERLNKAIAYSEGDAEMALFGLAPKVSAAIDVGVALMGFGGQYDEFDVWKRLSEATTKNTPAIKGMKTWLDRIRYPELEDWYFARRATRQWKKENRDTTSAGTIPGKVKEDYYKMRQHFMRADLEGAREELKNFVKKTTQEVKDKGGSVEDVMKKVGLLRQSIVATQPLNINEDDRWRLLGSLAKKKPDKAKLAFKTQLKYDMMVEQIFDSQ